MSWFARYSYLFNFFIEAAERFFNFRKGGSRAEQWDDLLKSDNDLLDSLATSEASGQKIASMYGSFLTKIDMKPIWRNMNIPKTLTKEEKCIIKKIAAFLYQKDADVNQLRIRALGTQALYDDVLSELEENSLDENEHEHEAEAEADKKGRSTD